LKDWLESACLKATGFCLSCAHVKALLVPDEDKDTDGCALSKRIADLISRSMPAIQAEKAAGGLEGLIDDFP
jgi:hypothetical protein